MIFNIFTAATLVLPTFVASLMGYVRWEIVLIQYIWTISAFIGSELSGPAIVAVEVEKKDKE